MDRSTRIAAVMANAHTRAAACVRAVVTNEDNEFRRALDKLEGLAEEYNIPMVAVGGAAVIHHGVYRSTSDIDIVVDRDQIEELLELAKVAGFNLDPDYANRNWPHIVYGQVGSEYAVGIDIIPSGAKARKEAPTTIPGPAELGVFQGLEYVCLHGLMELKLSSGRGRDDGDVLELIKRASPEAVATCENHLRRVHPQYLDKFVNLYIKARQEMQQEEDLEW